VFGERASAEDVLRDDDRLELLRPLQVDPKEARRRRASKPAR
jgi:putative ubiquitin-RnfH superfamily antitoxin RatB of RatAB toxin-antitoxin module